jgi:hypothetical protein
MAYDLGTNASGRPYRGGAASHCCARSRAACGARDGAGTR